MAAGEAWNKKSTKLKEDGNDAEGAKDQSGHGEVTVKLAPQVSSTGANPARKEKRGVSLMGSAEWGNSGNGTKVGGLLVLASVPSVIASGLS